MTKANFNIDIHSESAIVIEIFEASAVCRTKDFRSAKQDR